MPRLRQMLLLLALLFAWLGCSNPGKDYQKAMCACRDVACVKSTANRFKDRLGNANPKAVAAGAACATRLVAKKTEQLRKSVVGASSNTP